MAHISYPFKKTNKLSYQKPASILTEDSLYWKKLGLPVLVKEFGAIDYLDFSPVEPYYFAATCSVRVQIYDPITKVVAKNISKFVEAAYGASFRSDGRLLVAGGEEAVVKLFDIQSKSSLREFTGHTAPVHRTFFTKDQVKIISFSDDKSVCLWDIATEEKVQTFSEHTDYVRAGAASPISPDIILSGGYDNMVKLYDCRSNETALTVNHGSPVESTLFLPSGGIFISAGGTEIKVWDIFNGGKLLANISQHHKTVTTLRLASNNSRLMSASLDRHVKIYDISTFKVIHNIDFPNAILSLAISENDDILAAGMVDGIISIRKREQPSSKRVEKKGLFKFAPDNTDIETILDVQDDDQHQTNKMTRRPKPLLQEHDKYLKNMEFANALVSVLKPGIVLKTPEKTTSVIQELLRRKVLHAAYADLDEKYIGPILKYFRSNLGNTRLTRTIIDAANVFIDIFEDKLKTFSEENFRQFTYLQKALKEEINVCQQVSELEGALCLVLAGAQIGTTKDMLELGDTLTPSSKAQREFVIDV